MDKLSIDNLFPCAAPREDDKPLDIYSLCNYRDNRVEKKINYNIDRLITLREDRRKKLEEQYTRIFKMCMTKIHLANNLNKTEVIYQVPDIVYRYPEYDPMECLRKLDKKLTDQCFVTHFLPHQMISISWEDIEQRRRDKRRE